jgi:predicted kinase
MRVLLLSGVPGSGKSSYVATLTGTVKVCSADHWFERNGSYQFNPIQLPQAHGACLRRFTETVQAWEGCEASPDVLVVDNTNTSVTELAPYYAIATAYGASVKLVQFHCDPNIAAMRNSHGVPLAGVLRMHAAIHERILPPFWSLEVEHIHTS